MSNWFGQETARCNHWIEANRGIIQPDPENMHMNDQEKNFRKQPGNSASLENYILYLFEQQHFVEARYYHRKLMELDASDISANILGYKLALAVMSPDIKEYERNLIEAGAAHEQLYALHLHYCLTFNDRKQMNTYLGALLEQPPRDQYALEGVWAAIQKTDDADFICRFAENHLPRIGDKTKVEKILKKKLFRMLLSVLGGHA